MLYMEDYLEMIEHLPNELRDRFTEMREMDLSVQNRVDSLAGREKTFFSQCRRLKTGEREAEFKRLKNEYSRVIEDASEKIQSAEECYNLVDRYLRKLDQELHKFKMELEADNRGITEILEKRSLEMDAANTSAAASAAAAAAGGASLGGSGLNSTKENRLPKKRIITTKSNQTIAHGLGGPTLAAFSGLESPLPRTKADRKGSTSSALGMMPSPSVSGPSSSGLNMGSFASDMLPMESLASPGLMSSSPSGNTYPLHNMGAGGNAIAAAASQAIAATQQLVPGRRTSSLKASYEAINLGQTHEFSIGRELAGAAQSAVAATALGTGGDYTGPPPSKRQKSNKRTSHAAGSSSGGVSGLGGGDPGTPGLLDVVSSGASSLMDDGSGLLDASAAGLVGSSGDLLGRGGGDSSSQEGSANESEWFDPAEPRYCICNQVSYGDMVACDNDECPYEWFHYPCVGITATPKGKWYCSTCLARKKKK